MISNQYIGRAPAVVFRKFFKQQPNRSQVLDEILDSLWSFVLLTRILEKIDDKILAIILIAVIVRARTYNLTCYILLVSR